MKKKKEIGILIGYGDNCDCLKYGADCPVLYGDTCNWRYKESNNPHIEAKIQEFSKKVDLLSRKTGFDGNKKEKTDFGFKTEIDWNAIENWLHHAFTDLLNMQKKEIALMLEGMRPNACDCMGASYECEHWGKHELIDDAITKLK